MRLKDVKRPPVQDWYLSRLEQSALSVLSLYNVTAYYFVMYTGSVRMPGVSSAPGIFSVVLYSMLFCANNPWTCENQSVRSLVSNRSCVILYTSPNREMINTLGTHITGTAPNENLDASASFFSISYKNK